MRNHVAPTGHLFHATRSYVCHFIAICEFRLELSSGNAQIGAKSLLLSACVTLKFDRWQNTIGHISHAPRICVLSNWSYPETKTRSKIGFDLCDFDL